MGFESYPVGLVSEDWRAGGGIGGRMRVGDGGDAQEGGMDGWRRRHRGPGLQTFSVLSDNAETAHFPSEKSQRSRCGLPPGIG
jgi:hypothetical protein